VSKINSGEIKIIWESESESMRSLSVKARILSIDNEAHILEVLSDHESSFWNRLKYSLKYLFKKESIVQSAISLSKKDIEKLSQIDDDLDQ